MKKSIVLFGLVFLFLGAAAVQAEDVKEHYSIESAMELEKIKNMFADGDVAFYWGNTGHPGVAKKFGNFKTSKRTNAFMKDREQACAWAMASSLKALRDRARREGANAVVNIVSNIKDIEESSNSEYSCLAGSVMVNVALKGDVVTLSN